MGQLIRNLSEMTQDAVAQFAKALQNPQDTSALQKAGITQSTGLVWYDLQAPAKNMIPVITPLRNKIARVSGNGGTATHWNAVTAINTAALRGFVPEGKRNGAVATTVEAKSASYKTLGLEDTVSFEAELAAVNFEDVRAMTAQRLLWATMIEEELAILGGNNGVALGTVGTVTGARAASGGTIAASGGTYKARCVALSLYGYLASSLANGVVQDVAVTTVDGQSFTYGGGSSQKSAEVSVAGFSGSTNTLSLSVDVVTGAVAYAWYVDDGAGGALTLQAITTINSVLLTSLTTGYQNVTAITKDASQNAYAFDGILYQAWTSGSGAYIANQATGTAGTGTPLTTDTAGGIVEIDALLKSRWDNYRLSPTVIYANAQEIKNITAKVLASSGATYNFSITNPGAGVGNITAGSIVGNYLNKFAMGGNQMIPLMLHPYVPAGTLIAVTENLPYPINNVPNVMEMKLRRDYYQMEWPLRSRQYETGVYCDGVLAHYFPPSIGIITNIANG